MNQCSMTKGELLRPRCLRRVLVTVATPTFVWDLTMPGGVPSGAASSALPIGVPLRQRANPLQRGIIDQAAVLADAADKYRARPTEGAWHPAGGFGSRGALAA